MEIRILPNLDCSSKDAIELATAKKTNGTTLTNKRFRKISPTGFNAGTILGKNMPIKLPTAIPKMSKSRLE